MLVWLFGVCGGWFGLLVDVDGFVGLLWFEVCWISFAVLCKIGALVAWLFLLLLSGFV